MKARHKGQAWVKALRRVASFLFRPVVAGMDILADWMESRVFQVIRVVVTLGIVWLLVRGIRGHSEGGGLNAEGLVRYGRAAMVTALVAAGMAILWSGSFCDGLAGLMLFFIDSADDRPLKEDPLDKLDRLVRAGRIRRARWLCKRMIWRKEGSRLALETLLAHLSEREKGRAAYDPRPRRVSGGK